MVASWKRLNIQLSKWEIESKPTRQPQQKTNKVEMCSDFTAIRIGAYMPMISKIKLPEMPGRIMAEIADRKSTRLNSSHVRISYAVFCMKKKRTITHTQPIT